MGTRRALIDGRESLILFGRVHGLIRGNLTVELMSDRNARGPASRDKCGSFEYTRPKAAHIAASEQRRIKQR